MARILIIDDDVQILNMLRQTLEREGYEVVEAPDGKGGVKTLSRKSHRPDYHGPNYA